MKFLKLTLLLMTLSQLTLAVPREGRESGGGDAEAIEFVSVARQVRDYLENSPNADINLRALNTAIASTTVESTIEDLTLDGKTKDAINYPAERKIVFNRQRWNAISSDKKPVLVLHEYLGIMRVPDVAYSVSKSVLNILPDNVNEIFQRGTLTAVKSFVINDRFTQEIEVGFIHVTVIHSEDRTMSPAMSVISLPDGQSDFNMTTLDINMDQVKSMKVVGTDLVIKGTQFNFDSEQIEPTNRNIQIKTSAGTAEYFEKAVLKP